MNPVRQFIERKAEILTSLEKDCIEVENVRAIIGGPEWIARFVCKAGVEMGELEEWIELRNPDSGRSIASYRKVDGPPEGPIVDTHALYRGAEVTEFPLKDLDMRKVFKNPDRNASDNL